MKELSVKEKAQAYDEAIERAKSIYNETAIPSATHKGICTYIFPEVKGNTESEEEKIRKDIIKAFKVFKEKQAWVGHCLDDIDWDTCISWLEKQGEQKSVWSEEDEAIWAKISDLLWEGYKQSGSKFSWDDIRNWVNTKLLKDRVYPQPKQEWSEEDKKIIDRIESEFLALHRGNYKNIDFNDVSSLTVLNWVRKIKSIRFQNTWKPSEEQIKVCKEVCADILSAKGFDLVTVNSELNRLEEQLKQL